jgi:hypothetical protein
MGGAVVENVTSASILRVNDLRRRVLKASRLISIVLRFMEPSQTIPVKPRGQSQRRIRLLPSL